MSIFSDDQQKALRELFMVLEKGIDLLANENLDKDLYDAFEKYAASTIKMVNEAYNPNYLMYQIETYDCVPYNNWSQYYTNPNSIFRSTPNIPTLNSAASLRASYLSQQINPAAEYRDKLKTLLKQLILLAQKVVYE